MANPTGINQYSDAPEVVVGTDPFDVPAASPAAAPADDFTPGTQNFDAYHEITVAEGETFRELATRAGADPGVLFNANRGVIGSNPSSITPGMVLAVPED